MLRSILIIAFALLSVSAKVTPELIFQGSFGLIELKKQVALHSVCALASAPLIVTAQRALINGLTARVGIEALIAWGSICLQSALIASSLLHFHALRENLSALDNYEDATLSFASGKIIIEGPIGPNSLRGIKLKIDNFQTNALEITSPGGLIDSALEIAAIVKERALPVHVQNLCASACVIIATASPYLTANRGALFGFHRGTALSAAEDSWSKFVSKQATEQLISALRTNSIPEDILTIAMSTPPQEMHYVSAVELERRGIIARLEE